MDKNLEYYMSLPYNRLIQFMQDDKDGNNYFARVLELDGCYGDGKTEQEALENLKEAIEGWFEVVLRFNDPIPEPVVTKRFNGKSLLRLPKSLHERLAYEAEKEGVTLNQ